MGAWIEIVIGLAVFSLGMHVAPYMGAWIEIPRTEQVLIRGMSHPTWVRGLKLLNASTCLAVARRTLHGCVD